MTKSAPKTRYKVCFAVIVLSYAIALKFAIVGTGINLVVVVASALVVVSNANLLLSYRKGETWTLYVIPLFLLLPLVSNPATFKLSSFCYGLMFVAVFQVVTGFLHRDSVAPGEFRRLLATVVTLYFIMAAIQFALFPFGIEINQIWESYDGVARVNSLATEPAYAGIVTIITFHSYLLLGRRETDGRYVMSDFIKDFKYWCFVSFIVVTTQSAYAVVYFAILLLSHVSLKQYFSLFLVAATIFTFVSLFEMQSVERLKALLTSAYSLDINEMALAEHSGSIRVAPLIILFEGFRLGSIYFWIGHGAGYSKELVAREVPGIDAEQWQGGGFIPSHIYNYGIIATGFFFYFLRKHALAKLLSTESLYLLLIFLTSSFNSQLFWYSILLFSANKHFSERKMSGPGESASAELVHAT